MALGAAPVHSVALTRSFSFKRSRLFSMFIAPFSVNVDGSALFYVALFFTCNPPGNMLY